METHNTPDPQYDIAKRRVGELKRFYINLVIFCILFIIFNGSDFFEQGFMKAGFGKMHFAFLIWGIFLAIRAVKLFLFNTDWEKKQLDKELKQN